MTDQPKPSARSVLRNYNFRLLWAGQGTSLLGDQFFLIALPWLVLKLTADPLALGTILALIGVPRAILMLVGGAITDRYPARTIMLVSDVLRMLLTALLALIILTGWMHLWFLYLLAVIFGVISGFFIPASSAMLPLLVKPGELAVSNSIYQGTANLSSFLGPFLAGGLIALFSNSHTAPGSVELAGIAYALAFDAFTFLVSVLTLYAMHWQWIEKPPVTASGNLLTSIREGVAYLWKNDLLRVLFLLLVAANFLFVGPVVVGIPVMADTRLSGGAAAFGTIMAAFGGGSLLGIVVSSKLLQVLRRYMGAFLVWDIVMFGVGLGLFGIVRSTWLAAVVMLVVGAGDGVLGIALITFLQQKTPKELLGRVMSLVMLAGVGLQPISQALTGAVIKGSLTGLFFAAGGLMVITALWLALQPVTRTIPRLMAETLAVSEIHEIPSPVDIGQS